MPPPPGGATTSPDFFYLALLAAHHRANHTRTMMFFPLPPSISLLRLQSCRETAYSQRNVFPTSFSQATARWFIVVCRGRPIAHQRNYTSDFADFSTINYSTCPLHPLPPPIAIPASPSPGARRASKLHTTCVRAWILKGGRCDSR